MKKMFKFIIPLTLIGAALGFTLMKPFLLFGNVCFSQPGGRTGGPGGPGKPTDEQIKGRVKEMAESVDLSNEQVEKIVVIQKEHFESMYEIMLNSSCDRSKMRETMDKMFEEMNTKIKAVMTDQQYKKYQEYEKSHRRGPGGPGGGGEPPSQR